MSFASAVTNKGAGSPRLKERTPTEKLSAKRVREAREKLTLRTGGKPEFQYDLLFMFVRNELSASLAIPVFAIVIACVAVLWVPFEHIAAWLAAVFVSKGILLHLCRQFLKVPRAEVKLKEWRRKLIIAELLYGTSWGLLAFTPGSSGEQSVYILIFATFIVVISMTMMFASTVLPIVYAGTFPITLALVFKFCSLDNSFYWILAGTALGVHGYFIFLMGGLNNTVLTMLSYRVEKDALIAEIEQSKSISDQARRNAEEANIAKSRFLATVSHELRTPLNAIIGFSEVMKSELLGEHSNPIYRDYASDIHDSGQHLLNLINEILDLSRIEAGRYELHEEDVQLKDIIEDCHRLTKLRAEEKKLTIVLNIEANLAPIWGDERSIRQVCLNLVSNAIKFTPTNGTIQLAAGLTQDGGQFLSVTDTGPGMAKEEIPKVLSSFGQGSLAHQTAEGGTGLGLPIVMGLMKLHDGEFKLDSMLRKGTTATAIFPKARVKRTLPPPPVKAEKAVKTTLQSKSVKIRETKIGTNLENPNRKISTDIEIPDRKIETRNRKTGTDIETDDHKIETPNPKIQRPLLANPPPVDSGKRVQSVLKKLGNPMPHPPASLKPMTGRKNQLRDLKQLAFGKEIDCAGENTDDSANLTEKLS